MTSKARQDNQKHQEAATVNKSLLTIDYASMYPFNNVPTYTYSISIPENISVTDYREEGDTIGFKKPKVRILNQCNS